MTGAAAVAWILVAAPFILWTDAVTALAAATCVVSYTNWIGT